MILKSKFTRYIFALWVVIWFAEAQARTRSQSQSPLLAQVQPQQQAQTPTEKLCESLSKYYIKTFHQHQALAQDIQEGRYWSLEDLNHKMELLELLGKYLFDTAKQLQRHGCDLDLELSESE